MASTDQLKIMLMVAALNIRPEGAEDEARDEARDKDEGDSGSNDVVTTTGDAAVNFLKNHPAAKIVVVIDTHCLDTGRFAWDGDGPGSYQSCTMHEVRWFVIDFFYLNSHTRRC